MYAQFALVIAATALISALNAATLEAHPVRLWLRAPVPPEQRNLFYRGFNRVYDAFERFYARVVGAMTRHGGADGGAGAGHRGGRPVGRRAPAHRLHPHRGPGLRHARRAVARRRGAGPHAGGDEQAGGGGARRPRGRPDRRDHRHLAARQQRPLGQRRGDLRHPQGLEPARQGARPEPEGDLPGAAEAGRRAARRHRLRAGAAAHPGHRQRRRLHHAGRDARRQLRLRQAAAHDPGHPRRGPHAERAGSASPPPTAPTSPSSRWTSTGSRRRL